MESVESYLPYILTGCIFYGFGLKWCHEYAKYWTSLRRDDQGMKKSFRIRERCEKLLTSHPTEGSLKLIAAAIGLAGTLTGGSSVYSYDDTSPKVATIYLFFAFSGLVDVLNFYFPHNISEGLVKLALAQSFFIEGFLFLWADVGKNPFVNVVLTAIVWTTSLAVTLELVWPEVKLLRACTTLLHGGWIAHMVRTYEVKPLPVARIGLAFSWHLAAASAMTLCIVAITRSCAPKVMVEDPPEIPIYDYCQEPGDQRI